MSFRFPFPNRASGGHVALAWIVLLACAGCSAQARDKEPVAAPAQAVPMAAKEPTGESTPVVPSGELSPNQAISGGALELAGDLRPDKSADLSFKIGGQLQVVRVARGERVKRGDVLAGLGDAEARAQLAQAEAAVAVARAQLDLAKDGEARATSLVAANAAPGSQATVGRLQVAIAQATLLNTIAARDLVATTLNNHVLKAPFDGEIVRVPDGVGQTVTPGTVLFRIEALDRLVLRATVSENDVDRLRVGDDVTIEAQGKKFSGKVRLVLRSLEVQSRRAPVEVLVNNEQRGLIAGSYVRASCRAR
jgi:membrane fusion protein (multidrug efflux system)